jgi:hypothetical protein
MPFQVEEFRDLIRLLEERPEWREELRRLVLTDELLTLPQLVRALTEAQARAEGRLQGLEEAMAALAQAQARTEERVGRLETAVTALVEAQARTEERVGRLETAVTALVEAQARTERQVADLTTVVRTLSDHVGTLTVDVGELKGDSLERRYRERAPAYFSRLVRRARVVSAEELATLLEGAVTRRVLTEGEAEQVGWADLILRGRRREDDGDVYLVVEISWGVGPSDVERAAARAALLARAGLPTLPVVAGKSVTRDARTLAQTLQVWQVTDGQVIPPDQGGVC